MSAASFLSANLKALERSQPGFVLPPSGGRIQLADGVWRARQGEQWIALHSRDPHREADRLAAELLDVGTPPRVLAVVGLAAGFLLDALERRGWTGKVLALEPEPDTVHALLERRDWQAWINEGRLRLLFWRDFAGASDAWRMLGNGEVEPGTWVNPVLSRIRPGKVWDATQVLAKIRFDAKANAEARREFGAPYLLNTLRNLKAIASDGDVASLNGAAARTPVIVVAAGPSLDRAVPMLQEAQHRALIVCVDTALRPLLQAGVSPHIAVAVDPTENNSRHLTSLPACPDTFLVTEGSVDPLAVKTFAGRTFFFRVSEHQPWPWLASLGRSVGLLRAWGSVLTTAFDLAIRMDADPLILVGADLAYSGGQPYCRGTVYEEDWRRRLEWGVPLSDQWAGSIERAPRTVETDVNGNEVRTAPHLVAFRDWLVDQTRKDSTRRFVNATGAGLLHGGAFQQLSPDQVLSQLPSSRQQLRSLVAKRFEPFRSGRIMEVARSLQTEASRADGTAGTTLDEWKAFAPGITNEGIAAALNLALNPASPADSVEAPDAPPVKARALPQTELLHVLVQAVPLVPLPMAPELMQRGANGARIFRFRTTTARIIGSTLLSSDGAVRENGQALVEALDLDHLVPGSYSICRDEVHFLSTDGTDPRLNGRTYSVMVPAGIAYVETLPLHEIVARGI